MSSSVEQEPQPDAVVNGGGTIKNADGPWVSVIVPAYKAAAFLPETLASVQAQTLTNWECLVVNDGSPDNTGEVAEQLAAADPRIRVLHQANGGVSRARNAGIAQAQGAYIALLDADDFWLPENLATKTAYLDQHPEVDFVFSHWFIGDDDLNNRYEGPRGSDQDIVQETLRWEKETISLLPSNLVYRRSCHQRAPELAFDPELSTAADQDYKLQMASRFTGAFLPQPLIVYRDRAGSMSTNVALMEADHLRVYRKAERLGLFPARSERNRAFANLYLILAGSWWKDGGKPLRGLGFLLKSALTAPGVLLGRLGRKLA